MERVTLRQLPEISRRQEVAREWIYISCWASSLNSNLPKLLGVKKNGVKWPKTLKRQWHQKWSLTQDTKENQEDKSLSFKPCTCFRHTVFATFPLNEEINHPAPDIFNNFKNVVRAILNFIDILYGSSISSNVNETSMSINWGPIMY